MELVYGYLTGPRFRQRIEAILEKFSDMRPWAKREVQSRASSSPQSECMATSRVSLAR